MPELTTKKIYSVEKYFAPEHACRDTKHEFFSGEMLAMDGADITHNTICANLIREIEEIIKKEKKCQVLISVQRIPYKISFYKEREVSDSRQGEVRRLFRAQQEIHYGLTTLRFVQRDKP